MRLAIPPVFAMLALACIGRAAPEVPHDPAFAEFAAWMERFEKGEADPGSGTEIAGRRAQAMKALIESDPERALALALPEKRRASLPAEVAAHVERQVSGRGDLLVGIAEDFQGSSRIFRDVHLGGEVYRAFVYGERVDRVSERGIPLSGIVLGKIMAVETPDPSRAE